MSFFVYIDIEYFQKTNDEVRSLSSKEVLQKQNKHELQLHDVQRFNAVNYIRDEWRRHA